MKKLTLTFEGGLHQLIQKNLLELNKQLSSNPSIVSFAATSHHETGKRVYMLGYHPKNDSPADTIFQVDNITIALFMEKDEMQKFENANLIWREGYVEIE